eukprot:TRINITY_DN9043_c0_g1_i3.p1 TRINITY_DN9043_c0_g1~~TRINITY_DN9043_c0_g1_i3.p1  ORF type:complete len:441 (+),score=118.01 TRINITY_DN9043_c0_g1_i3:126-1448(+)
MKGLSGSVVDLNARMVTPTKLLSGREYTKSAAKFPHEYANESLLLKNMERSRMELNDEELCTRNLSDLIKKINKLGDELKKKRQALTSFESERNEWAAEKKRYASMESEYEMLKLEHEKLKYDYEKIASEIQGTRQEQGEELEHLKRIIEQLESKIATSKTAAKREEERIYKLMQELEMRNDSLINEIKILKEENKELYKKVDGYRDQEQSLTSALEKAKDLVSKMTGERNELLAKIEIFGNENSSLQALLSSEKKVSENLFKKLALKHKECEGLYTKTESKTAEQSQSNNDIVEKQARLIEMLENTIKDDKVIISKQERDNSELHQSLLELREDAKRFIEKVNNEEVYTADLKDQIRVLEISRNEAEAELREMKQENRRLNEEINEFALARQKLTTARMKEIDKLSNVINKSYGHLYCSFALTDVVEWIEDTDIGDGFL